MSGRSQLWWEGAEWAKTLIGDSEGEQCVSVCDRIAQAMESEVRPPDYKAGALALVDVARLGPGSRMAP
jgi:hypothetical protein